MNPLKFGFIILIPYILGFFINPFPKHPNNLKALAKEFKTYKKQSNALHKLWRTKEKYRNKISKKSKSFNVLNFVTDTSMLYQNHKKYFHTTLNKAIWIKDSCYYQNKIIRYKNDIALCMEQTKHLDLALEQVQTNSSLSKKNVNKHLYYLGKRILRKEVNLFKKFKLKSLNELLNTAKLQNKLLSAQLLKNPTMLLPSNYQLKQKVQTGLPQNNAGLNQQQQDNIKNKFDKLSNAFNQINDSIKQQKVKDDSLTFKPNPYRALPFKNRIENGFNWQTRKAVNYFPALIDLSIMIGLKVSPKFTPQLGIVYIAGLGKDIEHIELSGQGYGLKGGANYCFYRNVIVFLSYEHTYYKSGSNELHTSYKLMPALVVGIGIKGKMTFQIGYDFLRYLNPQKGNALIIRFGI